MVWYHRCVLLHGTASSVPTDGLHMCIAHTGLAREPSTRGFRPGMSLFFVQWVVERHGNLGRDGTTFVWLCLVADVLICYEIKILLVDW